MARGQRDWGPIPSPQDVADLMNSIEKLQDDVNDTKREEEEVVQERRRREAMLENSRAELGRMLKARAEKDLDGTEFRVVHRGEVHGEEGMALFGMGLVRHG